MTHVENGTELYGGQYTGEAPNERMLADTASGLNTTSFCVASVEAFGHLAVKVTLELSCNRTASPWCLQEWDLHND